MILINLLPHRAEKRRQRKRAFFAALGAAALGGALVVALWAMVLQQLTSVQQARNEILQDEIKKLEEQIKGIATLNAEIDGLKARQEAVENLQTNRNVPVYLLDELVKQTPEGIYLTAVKQSDQGVAVTGMAQTNERVSEMLRNVQGQSEWLTQPELVEIRAVMAGPNSPQASSLKADARRLYEFTLKVVVKQPGGAASAPEPAASGVPRKAA